MSITLKDVAKEAGVGVSTVSYVLNRTGLDKVSKPTQKRIVDVAASLNYRPSILGRSLSNRKSYLIGFVFNTNNLWHHAEQLIGELHKQCLHNGYSLVAYPSESVAEEFKNLQQAIDRQLDGLLILPSLDYDGSNNSEEYCRIAKEIMPVVQVCSPLCPRLPCISHDFRYIARTATEHLYALGHRRIALATFDNFLNSTDGLSSYEHYQGYLAVMNSVGLKPQVFAPDSTPGKRPADVFYPLGEKILEQPSRPTAVVVSSNSGSQGLIKRWSELGISVPDDISVIGCANDFDIPDCLAPKLTSFASEFDHIARFALINCLGKNKHLAPEHSKVRLKLQAGETVRELRIEKNK